MTTDSQERRATDPMIVQMQGDITHLHECVEAVKAASQENSRLLTENTEITKQVRDILATFKIVGAIAKWLTAVGGAILAVYHGWHWVTGR